MKRTMRIFGQALRAIGRNKGRSFLTMLGIIIGIASVIALVAVGNGASNRITGRIASLGTNVITVRSGAAPSGANAPGGGGLGASLGGGAPRAMRLGDGGTGGFQRQQATLTTDDLKALKDSSTGYNLAAVAGYVSSSSELALHDTANGAAQTQRYTISGTEPAYLTIQGLTVASGKGFTDSDVNTTAKVAVLGSNAATDLFGSINPIGQTIKLEDDTYTVVGVLSAKEESGFNNANRQIYVPFTSAQATYTITNLSAIYARATSDAAVANAKTSITNKLLALHGKTAQTADFSVSTPEDLLNTVKQSAQVTGDILQQFMFESILLCVIGGLLGIAVGALAAANLGRVLSGITPVVSVSSIVLAVAVSTTVGLVFGIYPAAKAAHLNPIDALRYE